MSEIRKVGQEDKKKILKKYCSKFTQIDDLLEAFNEEPDEE